MGSQRWFLSMLEAFLGKADMSICLLAVLFLCGLSLFLLVLWRHVSLLDCLRLVHAINQIEARLDSQCLPHNEVLSVQGHYV